MNIINNIRKNPNIKKLLLVLIDFFILSISLSISFLIRIGEFFWTPNEKFFFTYLLLISLIYFFFYGLSLIFGFYNIVVRYVDLSTIFLISKIVIILSILWGALVLFFSIPGFPRSMIIIYPTVIAILFFLSRKILQFIVTHDSLNDEFTENSLNKKKVTIYGAGSSGTHLAQALIHSNKYKIINFIDDDVKKIGRNIFGINIISFSYFLKNSVPNFVDEIHLALPRINRKERTDILTKLSKLNIQIRTLPPLNELLKGDLSNIKIQNLDIEDLLERDTAIYSNDIYEKIFNEKVVLVTGAGGSIGSELCRQIINQKPKKLILFDISEYAIYKIQQEFDNKKLNNEIEIIYLIGSVQDSKTVESIISKWRPNTIYHTAAYKHVPIVENNFEEGFKNNVLGTLELAMSSVKHDVDDFVLISTDKAVRPANIMGLTKRFSELILQGITNEYSIEIADREGKMHLYPNNTNFSIVRFGNVFESSGSVVPLFKKQINEGGPITITHKDVTRYFMTTKEASQLVILAGSFKNKSNPSLIYLLDMGQPIKIYDLAKKMIIQNGLRVKDENNKDGDIEIKFIGLRPGEKIFEELLISGKLERTHYEKIYRSEEPFKKWHDLQLNIKELEKLFNDNKNFISLLKKSIR